MCYSKRGLFMKTLISFDLARYKPDKYREKLNCFRFRVFVAINSCKIFLCGKYNFCCEGKEIFFLYLQPFTVAKIVAFNLVLQ